MGYITRSYYFLLSVTVLFPANYAYFSRATYYGSPDCYGTSTGACGYGEFGRTVNDGRVTGVSNLYKNGTGCGACYQIRCKIQEHCSEEGAQIVVTDYGEGDRTDFILSTRAYASLARSDSVKELFGYGVIDVAYKRIPCQYSGYNLNIKVHEHSKYPDYLAIIVLYVDGQNDITALDVWQEDCKEWRSMRRAYGAVFDIPNPPLGPLTFRVQVSGNFEIKWVTLNNVIMSQWKAGLVFDTNILLN